MTNPALNARNAVTGLPDWPVSRSGLEARLSGARPTTTVRVRFAAALSLVAEGMSVPLPWPFHVAGVTRALHRDQLAAADEVLESEGAGMRVVFASRDDQRRGLGPGEQPIRVGRIQGTEDLADAEGIGPRIA